MHHACMDVVVAGVIYAVAASMYGTRTRFVLVHIVPMSKHFECLARIVKQTRGIAFAILLPSFQE
jgi:hypothetical protein